MGAREAKLLSWLGARHCGPACSISHCNQCAEKHIFPLPQSHLSAQVVHEINPVNSVFNYCLLLYCLFVLVRMNFLLLQDRKQASKIYCTGNSILKQAKLNNRRDPLQGGGRKK